jgi:uncharacterized cupin superfamily protein
LDQERRVTIPKDPKFSIGKIELNPGPIRPGWIIEGNPISRNKLLSYSADGSSSTMMWDCTAGRFNWYYDIDETLCVIEGSVNIKDSAGVTQRLGVGDTVFFPAGSRAEWHVEEYIRKIAFLRTPLPAPWVFVKRGFRFLGRILRVGADTRDAAPAMFRAD